MIVNPKLVPAFHKFHQTLTKRGNKGLFYKLCFNGVLTNAEKDEVLICSRIAKRAK